ncbi:MAG: peptidyl-prolyl cis-trans isomerase [Planctomycetales bacterium]|nr:peptidyl-prolyl cis-trans isomerase [Planctomycetales bacterium]
MASPFRIFRKHEKLLIAIAAVVAMFVFVVADPLMSWLQKSTNGGQGSPTATLVSWEGGSINARELESLRQRRYVISNFLKELLMSGAQRVYSEGGTPLDPTVPNFILEEGATPQSVMVGAVTTRLLAEQATEAGMTVSDEMINHYLREFGLRKVTDAEIAQILQKNSRSDIRFSEKQLFAGLRELLLGNYYMRSYYASAQNVMPEERWQDWQRINYRIALDAAVLPTDGFRSKVPEPSDSDLAALYDEFKERVGDLPQMVLGVQLNSPDPGFREPRRAKLQYLLGDVNAWTQKLLDTVTDEEITDYYERNKRTQFVKEQDLFSDEPAESEAKEPAVDEADSASATEPESPAESPEEETTEPEESEPVESEGSSEPTEEETTTPEESAPEEPATEEAEEPDPAAEPAAEESSSALQPSPFRLVAFQDEQAPAENEDESPEETGDEPESEAAQDEPATEAADGEDQGTDDEPVADKAEASDEAGESSDEESVEYEPLENVRDLIRQQLANDKAVVELERVMGRAFAGLQSEYNRYGGEVIEARSQELEVPAPPAALANLGETATEYGLIFEETVLLSPLELSETAVGRAVDAQTRRQPVARAAFLEMELYEPFLSQDLDGHWYLVVKVEDAESHVPPLEEVKDRVADAWKQREAAKLALARAEELAQEAEKSGETLPGFFADKNIEVVTTDMFSWLTFGTTPAEMQSGARLGEAPPLQSIGPEFMTKAFELEPEKVIGVLNHDQTSAYVLRLNRREKSEAELHEQFLAEANDWFGGRVMMSYRFQNAQRELLGQLTDRVGLDLTELEEYLKPNEDQ